MKRMRRALLLFTLIAGGSSALAQAPHEQVAGFYRLALPDMTVTALYDGNNLIDRQLLKGASAEEIQALLDHMFIGDSEKMQTAVNAYLIESAGKRVLIDTGSGQCFGPALGKLHDNLKAAGYQPEQIDLVLLTHLHPDHACGLRNAAGERAFSNAEVKVAQGEANYWLSEAAEKQAPAEHQGMFRMAREAVQPYKNAGRFSTFKRGDILLPGLQVIATPGHTPGYVSYRFEAGDQHLLVWGDIIHNHAVQFPRPDIAIEFDSDSQQAIATRREALALAAQNRLWVAGAHLPFPGIGHVRAEQQGYAWVPVEYKPLDN